MYIGKKLRDILNMLSVLVDCKVDKTVSDDDFIAGVDAFNLLCNLYNELGLDRSEIRRRMDGIYPEFSRRIRGKKDIQLSMPPFRSATLSNSATCSPWLAYGTIILHTPKTHQSCQ